MSEQQTVKRPEVEALLEDVFKLMEYPAKLDFKEMPDGALGVACHFEGELPGITEGKRSYLVDCVQFWVNKAVNRPNTPRRWVNLGINAFPEPRTDRQQQQMADKSPQEKQVKVAAAPAPAAAPMKQQAPQAKPSRPGQEPQRTKFEKGAAPARGQHGSSKVDERSLTPAADPVMTAAGKLLAEKSAKLGRIYAVMGLTNDQRALMIKSAEGLQGVTVKAEGEGHWRRLVTVPDKVTVIAKKQIMPDYDDEEDE